MKHILWALVLAYIATLAFGPVWVDEYDMHKRRIAEDSYADHYYPQNAPTAMPTPDNSGDHI